MSDDKYFDFTWMDEEDEKAKQYFEKRAIEIKIEKAREKLKIKISKPEREKLKNTDKYKSYMDKSKEVLYRMAEVNIEQLRQICKKYDFSGYYESLKSEYMWDQFMDIADTGGLINLLATIEIFYKRISKCLEVGDINIPELKY